MENIKSFEDACQALQLNPDHLPVVDMLPEKHQKHIIAGYKLITIAEALNEGWTPNWNDENQYKYQAYFGIEATEEKPSGFGFSRTYYAYWLAVTYVGSRLCFKSRDLALYFAKNFTELHKEYMLLS